MAIKIKLIAFDIFCKIGGIQKASKNLCHALNSITNSCQKKVLEVYSLNDSAADLRYIAENRFFGFKGSRIKFIFHILYNCINADKIIICHLHLTPILFLIKLFNWKCDMILIAHGTEFWRKLKPITLTFIKKHITVWSVSSFTKNSLIKLHTINANQICVLNNCIDPYFQTSYNLEKPTSLLEHYQLTKSQPILLTICRITPHEQAKGYDLVLSILPELIKELPNIHYLIGGQIEDAEKNRLDAYISTTNLKNHVTVIGFISECDLENHYQLADLFVMPSSKEGFGLVFIEAICSGCITIAGNSDGSADALMNGRLGDLVDPKNTRKMTSLILKRLRESSKQKRLSNQKLCIKKFNHKVYRKKIQHLLK